MSARTYCTLVTVTYSDVASEDECKWFIAIWFILLKQTNKYDNEFNMYDGLIIFTHTDNNIKARLNLCTMGPLCHAWLFFPSSSCSMQLLTTSLLAVDCLSCSLSGGPGPPSSPPSGSSPFPLGPRQYPTLLTGTSVVTVLIFLLRRDIWKHRWHMFAVLAKSAEIHIYKKSAWQCCKNS